MTDTPGAVTGDQLPDPGAQFGHLSIEQARAHTQAALAHLSAEQIDEIAALVRAEGQSHREAFEVVTDIVAAVVKTGRVVLGVI